MTPEEHYAEAENLLQQARVKVATRQSQESDALALRAQAHATLAAAGAQSLVGQEWAVEWGVELRGSDGASEFSPAVSRRNAEQTRDALPTVSPGVSARLVCRSVSPVWVPVDSWVDGSES